MPRPPGCRLALLGLLPAISLAISPSNGRAGGEEPTYCRIIEVGFTPADDLQIVVWLEAASQTDQGDFLETLFITRTTGTYGLGNRPGIMDFNSSWAWPYGRRLSTFPIWAHRHGLEWPLLVFQDGQDRNLSHSGDQSSHEPFYCRPLLEGEPMWDTESCASLVWTDKGTFSDSEVSLYPPRNDLTMVPGTDAVPVESFAGLNPFDAVSMATPPGGMPFAVSYAMPRDMATGSYVAWVEVSKEFDQNEHYNYPAPVGIPYDEFGLPYRGQPSVVYRVPFTVEEGIETIALAEAYLGYGDPDGLDGDIREPDNTIAEGIDGTGAGRLLLTDGDGGLYRVRVSARPAFDTSSPGLPRQMASAEVAADEVTFSFIAPGDDAGEGQVRGYEIRYTAGAPLTEANFTEANAADATIAPAPAGTEHTVTLTGLLPSTNYYIGVRAFDDCLNKGPPAILQVTTPRREAGEVDACFIATAAFGSPMMADVAALRRFRDAALRSHVPGELLVEAYYTFAPPLARVIAPSDTLRALARGTLAPVVAAARRWF